MDTQNAIRAADFTNNIGVNVHLEYTDGKYASVNSVINDLRYLGVDLVRDGSLSMGNQGQESYGQLASAGVKFDMIVFGDYDIGRSLSLLGSFAAAHPGAISSIEGPNEINNFAVSFQGLTGAQAAVPFQAALFNAVNSDPTLSALPVYNFTSWPPVGGQADYGNFHSYAHNGDQPLATMLHDYADQRGVMPTQPMVLTEAGYFTLPNGSGWGGVDQATQAKLTLNLLFDAAQMGVKQTFLYELLDAYADPTNNDQEKHFGLFDINNNPKLVATAIHNLTSILDDSGAGAASFAPGGLSYTLAGLPSTAHSLVIAKSSGVYDVVVWNEPDIWNEASHTPIAAPAQSVTLQLAQNSSVSIYDPLLGAGAQQQLNGQQIQFTITDHPVILEVRATGAAGGGGDGVHAAAPSAPAPAAPAVISLDGDTGDNALTGTAGDDYMRGLDGNDTVNGGAGADDVNGNVGSDIVHGGDGNDWSRGGKGDDLVFGDAGDDPHVNGNIGNDIVYGGAGNDTVYGGQDNDQLFGDLGDDRLSGDLGNDTLTGGAGADRFVFGPNSGVDVITDFNSAEGDRIELAPGTAYTVSEYAGHTVIDLGGGAAIGIMGVTPAALGDWLVFG